MLKYFPPLFLSRTIAAATYPVTATEVKEHLRVDDTASDDLIDRYIARATQFVEEAAGKQLITQTWKATYPKPPYGDYLPLPRGPVQSITSIQYYDADNASQTMTTSPETYRLVKDDDMALVELVTGQVWPTVYDRLDAFSVTFVCGYGAASAVPDVLKQAIELTLAHWFENREGATDRVYSELPLGVVDMIGIERKGWFAA